MAGTHQVDIAPLTGLEHDQATVTTAGTAVQITPTGGPSVSISIKALSTNTDLIYVGGSAVDSTNGYELSAGQSVSMDLNTQSAGVWIDSAVNGEGVCWMVVNHD